MKSLAALVADIRNLSLQDKYSLHAMIHKMLIEERRNELYKDHLESIEELKAGKLTFYNNPNDLLNELER